MKKTMKRWFSLLLVLAMMVSLSAVFADSGTGTAEDSLVYVNIGDSIASGLGLPDYYNEDGSARHHVRIEGSYPAIFSDEIGATETINLANPGYRTNELYMMLDDSYSGDAITSTVIPAMTGLDMASFTAEMRPKFADAIDRADVITIQVGSNNVMMRMMLALFKIAWGYDMDPASADKSIFPAQARACYERIMEALAAEDESALAAEFLALLEKAGSVAGALDAILVQLDLAMDDFRTYYAKSIAHIQSVNPDAVILAVGLYNPLRDAGLSEDISIPVGHIIDPVLAGMNEYMEFGVPGSDSDNYIYVNEWNAEVIETINLDEIDVNDAAFFDKIKVNIHPNLTGHRYMADQLLDAYYDRTLPFTDVDRSTPYFREIAYCYEHGYMIGTSAHTFAPDMNINRGMFATALYAASGLPRISIRIPFIDVSSDAYYSRSVAWLYSLGLTAGVNYNLFAPLSSIRTQDMVLMLYNYAGSPTVKADLSVYSDSRNVSLYAKKAMAWAVSNSIIDVSDGTLDARSAVSRAELAYAFAHFDKAID